MKYRNPDNLVSRCCGYALLMCMVAVAGGCAWLSADASAADNSNTERIAALYLEARLAMSEHLNEQAADRLDQALKIPGCPPEVYDARADLYAQSAKGLDNARNILNEGLKRYPKNPDLMIGLAELDEQSGKIDQAIKTLEDVLKQQPNRRSVLERLSQLHLKRFRYINSSDQLQREVQSLIDIYQRMLSSSRGVERVGPLLVLSSLYMRVNKTNQALDMAKEAVAIRPRDPRTQLALGSVHQMLNQRDDALAAYRRALLLNPSLEEAIKGVNQLLGGNKAKLLDFYRGLSEEAPHSAELQVAYAQLLIQARRWAEAEKVLKALLGDRPDSLEASIGLMAALQSQKKIPEALEVGRAALHHDPKNQDLLNGEGELLRSLPDQKTRAEWYAKLSGEFEGEKEVQLLVARELVREQRWPEAEKQLDMILKRWPADPPTRLALVRTWLALNKLDKAEAEARELAKQKSDLTTVVSLAVAESLQTQKKTDQAIRFVQDIRRMRPDDEGLTVWYGWLLLSLKRSNEALTMLDQFRAAHPNSYEVVPLLVQGYADAGQYDRAVGVLNSLPKKMVEEKGDDIQLMRANIDRRRHKYTEALATLQELIKKTPTNAGFYQEMGQTYQEMGRNAEAEQAYKRAIDINPNDPENYNTLGYFYAETNQKLDEALKLITKALELKPDAGHIVDSLGWVYYQRGEYKKAAEMLARAAKLMSDHPDPVILDHLGDAQAKTGNTDSAREAWRKALELKPDKPELIQRKLEGGR